MLTNILFYAKLHFFFKYKANIVKYLIIRRILQKNIVDYKILRSESTTIIVPNPLINRCF